MEDKERNIRIVEDKKIMSYTELSAKYRLSITRLQDIINRARQRALVCPQCGYKFADKQKI